MHPGWLSPPYAELQISSRMSQCLHSMVAFLCWLSVLANQCPAAGVFSHLGSNSICRLTFLRISFLVSKKLLQAVYISPGLLAHRWHYFFRTVKLNLTSHATIETAFAFCASSLWVPEALCTGEYREIKFFMLLNVLFYCKSFECWSFRYTKLLRFCITSLGSTSCHGSST